MTEQEMLEVQLAAKYPEDKELWQGYMNKYGVKGTLTRLRQKNADRNRGELNCQFIMWIQSREEEFCQEIKKNQTDEKGKVKISDQKAKFTFYGMLYVILVWDGCYVRGKGRRNAPNEISYNKFCSKELFNLEGRFNSNNVRKTLVKYSSFDYLLDEDDSHLHYPEKELKPVFNFIQDEIVKHIDEEC